MARVPVDPDAVDELLAQAEDEQVLHVNTGAHHYTTGLAPSLEERYRQLQAATARAMSATASGNGQTAVEDGDDFDAMLKARLQRLKDPANDSEVSTSQASGNSIFGTLSTTDTNNAFTDLESDDESALESDGGSIHSSDSDEDNMFYIRSQPVSNLERARQTPHNLTDVQVERLAARVDKSLRKFQLNTEDVKPVSESEVDALIAAMLDEGRLQKA
eukprot:jgi/Chlat1/5783/Chrsp387S05518